MSIDKRPIYSIIYINKCADGKKYHPKPTVQRTAGWCKAERALEGKSSRSSLLNGCGMCPCKQRRLQPLQCGTLLEVREWACVARQREWYRRELDDHKVFVSWFNRGQRPFLLKGSSPGTCKKWKKVRKTGETHHAVEWFSDFVEVLCEQAWTPFWLSRRRSAEPLR